MNWQRVFISIACCLVLSFYLALFHYTEPTQVGVARNWITGRLWADTPGWNITAPWVTVSKIDTRPIRVCVTTSGRGFNCKLAQFEPSAYKEFVATEGFYYHWWANRFSFNWGYNEEYRGMKDLLRGYAYGVKKYSFVTVLIDYKDAQ